MAEPTLGGEQERDLAEEIATSEGMPEPLERPEHHLRADDNEGTGGGDE